MSKPSQASYTRILIFNFFGGVMDRGIPLYARDIAECMRRAGFLPFELRCPGWLRRAPRPVRNIAFVLFEQVVAPITRVARGCEMTVYPYNSAGLIDAVLGRSIVVVHDLLPNRRENKSLAARYIRLTQSFHSTLRRPVCAASLHTLKYLRRLKAFRFCRINVWSNPFYSFGEALLRVEDSARESGRPLRVLLCSGIGPNKDYAGALRIFRRSRALKDAELRIVGFGTGQYLAARRTARLPASLRNRIVLLPRLTLEELVTEYRMSDLVWIHSKREGFGRWIVEALLCGRPVVASRIGAFRRFASIGACLYDKDDFDSAVASALSQPEPAKLDLGEFHGSLEASVRDFLVSMIDKSNDFARHESPPAAATDEPAVMD